MSNLWFFNQFEIIGYKNYTYSANQGSFYRDLLSVEKNDLFIQNHPINTEFLNYVSKLKSLQPPNKWIIDICNKNPKFWQSKNFTEILTQKINLQQTSNIDIFNPFIETNFAVEISEKLGLPLQWSKKEVIQSKIIEKFNNKYFFKKLASANGIPIIPGKYANTKKSLQNSIRELSKTSSLIIVKNSSSAGGFGNRLGTAEELISTMNLWYKADVYLVEPYLDLKHTVGSLSIIHDHGAEFIGLDEQIIENLQWKGCSYPFQDNQFDSLIKNATIKISNLAHQMGIRGYLNLDWGIAEEPDGNLQCYIIECNLRNNGFYFILHIADSIYGLNPSVAKIKYVSNLPVNNTEKHLSAIINKLANIRINNKSIFIETASKEEKEGVIITSYLEGSNSIGLLVASKEEEYINEVICSLNATL